MTKKELKEFVKNHKEKFVFGTIIVVAVAAEYIICKKVNTNKLSTIDKISKDHDVDWFIDMCKDIDLIKGDSECYVPIVMEDVAKMIGDERIIRDPSGNLMKVAGAIIFGDKVEI
jgi:hypothetical protein